MKNKKRPKIERDDRKMNVIKGTFGYLVNFYKMCLYSIVIIPVVIGYTLVQTGKKLFSTIAET